MKGGSVHLSAEIDKYYNLWHSYHIEFNPPNIKVDED